MTEKGKELLETLVELNRRTNDTLRDLLQELNNSGEKVEDNQEEKKEKIITEKLFEIGIPASILGFDYAKTAISLCIDDETYLREVVKRLYVEVAKINNTTPTKAERAIRHAIEVAWRRGKQEVIEKIFGYTISAAKGKPTNSEFIAMMTKQIKILL